MKKIANRRLLALACVSVGASAFVFLACGDDDVAPTVETKEAGTDAAKVVYDASSSDSATPSPPGCFSGAPTTHLELINACTTSQYVVIDNCARIGFCDGGALPARNPPPDGGSDAGDAGDGGHPSDAGDGGDADSGT